jgi:hypothetical protein
VKNLLKPISDITYGPCGASAPSSTLAWIYEASPSTPLVPLVSIQASAIAGAEHLFQTLDGIASLDNDWDGYGALKISDEAIAASRQIIGNSIGLQPFDLTPRANGTLAMEWQQHGHEAYVEIGKTRISGYVMKESRETYFLDLVTIGAQLSLPAIVNTLLAETPETVEPVSQVSYEHAVGADG